MALCPHTSRRARVRRNRWPGLTLALAMASASGLPARALALEPVYVSTYTAAYECGEVCQSNGLYGTGNQTSMGPNTFSSATIEWAAAPVISTYSSADLRTGTEGGPHAIAARSGGDVTLVYQFQLAGPATVGVPVLMKAAGSLLLTGSNATGENGVATLHLKVLGAPTGYLNPIYDRYLQLKSRDIGPDGRLTASFDDDRFFNVASNTLYEVQMHVSSVTFLNPDGAPVTSGLVSSATLDPLFQIDPVFQSAFGDYHFVFSSGLSPTAPVPLPPTAAMFGAGLVALAGLLRRQRRQLRPDTTR